MEEFKEGFTPEEIADEYFNFKNIQEEKEENDHSFREESQESQNKRESIEKKILNNKKSIIGIYTKGKISDSDKNIIRGLEDEIRKYEVDIEKIDEKKDESVISKTEEIKRLTSITKDTNIGDIIEDLKTGVAELMTSDRYKNFLDFRSSLYQYSYNNCLLIAVQNPDATMIGSFNFWKANNRYVKKGEKGLLILAPVTAKKQVEEYLFNKDHTPVLNEKGEHVKQPVDKTYVAGFKLTSVFDISQTDGEPIPDILSKLSGNSPKAEVLVNTITSISEIPISYENITSGANGYYEPDEKNPRIVIKKGMSMDQTAKTLIHEYTHSKLHNDINEYRKSRDEAEIQAESTAYVVSKHFGLDTSEYSFGYVSHWAQGKDLESMQETLKIVSDTAKIIINEIENKLAAEYELLSEKSKDEIKKMVKESGFTVSDKVVDNIHKLHETSGKKYSLKQISDFYKDPESFSGSQEDMKYINKVGSELKQQELSEKNINLKFDIEPSMA